MLLSLSGFFDLTMRQIENKSDNNNKKKNTQHANSWVTAPSDRVSYQQGPTVKLQ